MWLITAGRRWETIHSYVTIDELIRRKGRGLTIAATDRHFVAASLWLWLEHFTRWQSLWQFLFYLNLFHDHCNWILKCNLSGRADEFVNKHAQRVKHTNSVNGTHLHFKIYSHNVSEQTHWWRLIFSLLCFFTPPVIVLLVYQRGSADTDHMSINVSKSKGCSQHAYPTEGVAAALRMITHFFHLQLQ